MKLSRLSLPVSILAIMLLVLAGCQTLDKPAAKVGGEYAPDPDQFRTEHIRVGQMKILGVEHLEPFLRFSQMGWHVYYEFHILDEKGKTTGQFISFGSYDSANEVSRALGNIKGDQRRYHLDFYEVNRETGQMISHSTLGFKSSETLPPYDTIRDEAVSWFDKYEDDKRK